MKYNRYHRCNKNKNNIEIGRLYGKWYLNDILINYCPFCGKEFPFYYAHAYYIPLRVLDFISSGLILLEKYEVDQFLDNSKQAFLSTDNLSSWIGPNYWAGMDGNFFKYFEFRLSENSVAFKKEELFEYGHKLVSSAFWQPTNYIEFIYPIGEKNE